MELLTTKEDVTYLKLGAIFLQGFDHRHTTGI